VDRRTVGYLLALGSAAAGAVRYNLAVFSEPYGFEFVPFLAYSLAIGVLCCTVHVIARDGLKGFVPLRGRWHHAVLYGVLMGWSTLSHFLALRFLNETMVVSLSQSGILMTIALAVWLLGERFTVTEWIATAIICTGVLFFRPWEAVRLQGLAILLSGAVCGALASVGAKRWVAGTPPRVLMLWRNIVALALVGTYTVLLEDAPVITPVTAVACVATGILGPYLHGLFFLKALERIDVAKASLTGRVQPAIVFLLSWLLLSRLPSANEMWSAAIIVLGTVWLVAARPKNA